MRGPIPDKPRLRPNVPEVQRLIDAFYQFPNCGVGGDLHSVLDDGNWEDGSIQWCIDHAGEWDPDREVEGAKLLGRILLRMTRTQRNRLDAGYDGAAMSRDEFLAECRRILATTNAT